jgi:hypothetical protein
MSSPHGEAPRALHPVRILNVSKALMVTVRFLGVITGMLEHWPGRTSVPCRGVHLCDPATHRKKTVWKGFCPVECWDVQQKCWIPFVLEVTENLEELLAGQTLRGMVWSLFVAQSGKKHPAIEGVPMEQAAATPLRNAFDVRPIVERIKHWPGIEWDVPNPVPRRVLLEAVYGDAPQELFQEKQEEPRKASADDFRRLREASKRLSSEQRPTQRAPTAAPDKTTKGVNNGHS